jgi:ribosomal protein L16 Arg81 hydroxylase
MAKTRHVVGHDVPGYIDLDSIREAFAEGATYKFSQPEHWHERIAELIAGLRPSFRGQTEAFVFLCPPDIVAMPAHMDGSHVFVLQVAGKKVWHVANPDETTTGLPERYRTSDIDPSRRIDFELEPGDVLYLPHGTPHYAMAKEGNSIHIAITVEEPTTRELADVVLADSLATQAAAALEGEYLRYGPSEAAERTRDVLRRFLAEGTRGTEALIEDAARLKTHVPPDPER